MFPDVSTVYSKLALYIQLNEIYPVTKRGSNYLRFIYYLQAGAVYLIERWLYCYKDVQVEGFKLCTYDLKITSLFFVNSIDVYQRGSLNTGCRTETSV